ncbi:hypothetical protein BYT27DRAFT_7261130 [Phlegmacium glaucopus]|nr:hypothetical protein BYT27DRAFT_7261130 [Phlegmacium glaucopus]
MLPHRKDLYSVIQGRIYKTNETCPRFTNIIAQDNGHRRFALVDSILDHLPHVCEVGVFDGKSINRFYIFFGWGHNIRLNRAVKMLSSNLSWTGDILILRGSARSEGVVNMRGHDRKLADFALKKAIQHITLGSSISAINNTIPEGLIFTKRLR